MKEEFKQFLSSPAIRPPAEISEQVLSHIHRDLDLKPVWTMTKLFLLYVLVGGATLSFCPQFNIGPVGKGITPALYHLMQVHPLLCAAFCGLVFLGSSALVSVLALRSSELIWLKKKAWWIYLVFAAFSLSFFMLAGAPFQGHFNLEFILMWSSAAIISAWIIIKIGTLLRIHHWASF